MTFTAQTFELLNDLKNSGKYAFYKNRESQFQVHLVDPFRNLVLYQVRSRLLPEIMESLETQKRLFGQINKNDFGKGGAYPFYWGAFYPKRASGRQKDAQLLVFIEAEYLEFGFFFGWQTDESIKKQFRKNSQLIYTSPSLFEDMLVFLDKKAPFKNLVIRDDQYPADDYAINSDGTLTSRKSTLDWRVFFQNLASCSDSEIDQFSPMMVLPKDTVLSLTNEELAAKIADTFNGIYPVMLLAISSDPHTMIAEYIRR